MPELVELVDQRTTVVTVNRRLARALLGAYAERAAEEGRAVWRTPDVLPFQAFISRAWNEFRDGADPGASLLSDSQERLFWEAVIRETGAPELDGEPVAPAAARRARDAFALMNAWNIDPEHPDFSRNDDTRAFRAWVRAFVQRCADGHWIDAGRAANALARSGPDLARSCNPRVVFAGFEILTPQQEALRAALRDAGKEAVVHRDTRVAGTVHRFVFHDPDEELATVARWARARLDADPVGTVGIIVPDLHLVRARVERIFEEELCPGRAMPGAAGGTRPFNLSLGTPLSRVTVIGDALLALELGRDRFGLDVIGRLLRSPYIGGSGEALGPRARFDARLRDIGEAEISLETLAARASGEEIRDVLEGLLARKGGAMRRMLLAEWSGFVSAWLNALGWPGGRSLDSGEYQAVDAFRGLLDDMARCAVVSSPQTFAQACALLRRFADEQIFQPRTDPAPVQIVGALEASGQRFSRLWVCGLADGAWPPPPEPSPFLPLSLQRRAGIPQAAPETQLALARERLSAWMAAAPAVILSHADFDGDEPLRPSPLVVSFPPADPAALGDLPSSSFTARLAGARPALERLTDTHAPALSAGHGVHAGAQLFRDQAACPFRAVAHHRLGAESVAAAVSALDPRVRGNLAHRALARFWSELTGHRELMQLDAGSLGQRIESAVEDAISTERRVRPDTMRGALEAIERERLTSLLGNWAETERRRSPFEVVAREEGIPVEFNGLGLKVRPDRIDRLEAGDYLVVDYKTGNVNPNDWFGPRPDDPQLAIYTVAVESAYPDGLVSGAAYGVLRRDGSGYRGYADREGVADGIGAIGKSRSKAARAAGEWPSVKDQWRRVLDHLAGEFLSGDARVAPKNGVATCRYCDAMPLCRIFEQNATVDDAEVDP